LKIQLKLLVFHNKRIWKIKNDYISNDNKLKKLFDEKIEQVKRILILPNIEFRLNKLVGKNRINFHVIFSDEIEIKEIKENFYKK